MNLYQNSFFLTGICIMLAAVTPAVAQTVEERLAATKVNELLSGPLPAVLDRMGEKFNFDFQYDKAAFSKHEFFYRPFDYPMTSVLDAMCKDFKLKYYVENDKVYIVGKYETRTRALNVQAQEVPDVAVAAQKKNITLSGVVKDARTGESLPYATVYAVSSTNSASTNTEGYFTLFNVPTDTSTIGVLYMGYKKEFVKLNPSTNTSNVLINLTDDLNTLDEVVVTGESEALIKIPDEISTVQMSARQLAALPNVGEKDIMRSFQYLPGVSASNESSSGLFIRGGTPDQNLVLYDGFTVYHVDHLYGFFSAFNSNALKDVKLYKGGFDAKYGGRLSGVTEITGKEGNQREWNAGAEISLLSANAFVEAPLGEKMNFLVAGRRSYKGPLYNTLFDKFNSTQPTNSQQGGGGPGGIGGQENVQASSYFYDLNGKFSYRPTEKDNLTLSFYNGTDNLDNSQKTETPDFLANSGINFNFESSDQTKYGNIGSSLKWGRKWNAKFYSNNLVSFSRYYSTRDRSTTANITTDDGDSRTIKTGTFEDNQLYDFSYRGDYTWDISRSHKIGFGAQLTSYNIDYSYAQSDTMKILDRKTEGSTSTFYLQDRIKIGSRLDVTPGLRWTHFSVTGLPYYEPRLSSQYSLSERIKLKAATGIYYQFANRITREDILSGSRDFWMLSDGEDIPVSKSTHYIAGVNYETKHYLFSVEGFVKNYDGLSEYTLRYNVNPNRIDYTENFYTGTGTVTGAEFLAQRKFGKITGWLGYTYLYARNKFDVYGDDYFPSNQDVTNEFKAVGIYTHKRWTFSATWIYGTGRPYTAPRGGYQLTLLDGSIEDYISVGNKNGSRLPDYHRLDLAANYGFRNQEGRELGYIGVSLFNTYNRTNVWYKNYQIVDNRVVETNVNYLGITPNLTLSFHIR